MEKMTGITEPMFQRFLLPSTRLHNQSYTLMNFDRQYFLNNFLMNKETGVSRDTIFLLLT